MVETFQIEWAGRELTIQTGKLAGQANGECTVRYGDTMVLVTAVMSEQIREGIDFFPLLVDFEERLYAAGKIKGSRFIKREGRPTDEAILSGRLVDRSIRPLFPDGLKNDVQIVATVMSVDQENDSDVPALVGAAAALMSSDIPWNGPIAAVRVGRVDGEWVVNPTFAEREKGDLEVLVAGTPERVLMLEAAAKQVPEEAMIAAIEYGQKNLAPALELIEKVRQKVGLAKRELTKQQTEEERTAADEVKALTAESKTFLLPKIREALFGNPRVTKGERLAALDELAETLETWLTEKQAGKEKRKAIAANVDGWVEAEVSRAILEESRRVDGRSLTDIRALAAEVSFMPRTHGSALFARGETQILSAVTLGAPSDEQTLDGMEESGKKRFFHHYNFPRYSVGEVGPNRGPGRREIGHGALAEKAIIPVLPPREGFPYAIRVVSEVLSSNGSSSMGSTCGSSLALMDAGVPVAAHVAGIAMGLATEKGTEKYKIITDLQDLEDGKGGMDFKIAGSRAGITAIQMDTKTDGLTPEVVRETVLAAREARLKVLAVMEQAIPAPRPELSPYAPRLITFKINPDLIRNVIGPGGKTINEIVDTTGVSVDVENDGTVVVCSPNAEAVERAVAWIKELTREAKPGEIFAGTVTRLMDFGAFVEILPKQEGLVHISELAPHRVQTVSEVVKVGDKVKVKVIEIDDQGRINLSIRQAADPNAPPVPARRPPPRQKFGHDRR
ncbi:polyribonucleotide nucleotidyltransferase [Patescibacteria group bacterium]|nr:MAG: polyribonucleotide nucleotidyltransferase [Patescibacteria group bacterium]